MQRLFYDPKAIYRDEFTIYYYTKEIEDDEEEKCEFGQEWQEMGREEFNKSY